MAGPQAERSYFLLRRSFIDTSLINIYLLSVKLLNCFIAPGTKPTGDVLKKEQNNALTAFRVNAYPDFEVAAAFPLTGDLFDDTCFFLNILSGGHKL
jgi:hypothetical protein